MKIPETFACRICGAQGAAIRPVLDLGQTALANRLPTEAQLAEPEPMYPLATVFCEKCSLVQITETVPPEILFRDYVYFSSFSDTMLEHSKRLAETIIARRSLTPAHRVVEMASNDGYLLQFFKQKGIETLGIEPARNIAKVAREKGIPTIDEFFSSELARRVAAEGKAADVFLGNNVLAHVAGLNDVAQGIREILKPGGMAIIEAPYLRDMIEKVEFDTIYHEHLCYFSLTALDHLFDQHELVIEDVERVPIHGGSLRVYIGRKEDTARGKRTLAMLEEERSIGLVNFDFHRDFADRVHKLGEELTRTLRDLKAQGKTICGYGAAAKGSTLLSVFGIGRDLLDFVADRSPHKQGKHTPGTHIPIVGPEALVERRPDYALLLAWNVADEVIRQQEEYRRGGGKFIIPVPTVRIVG